MCGDTAGYPYRLMLRFTRRAGPFYPVFLIIDNPFSILLFYLRHFYIAVFGLKKCNIECI